jgi:hypothetical protein
VETSPPLALVINTGAMAIDICDDYDTLDCTTG